MGWAVNFFSPVMEEGIAGFSFEKTGKTNERSQPKGEKRKADSGSIQPEGEASSKKAKSKYPHFAYVLIVEKNVTDSLCFYH